MNEKRLWADLPSFLLHRWNEERNIRVPSENATCKDKQTKTKSDVGKPSQFHIRALERRWNRNVNGNPQH